MAKPQNPGAETMEKIVSLCKRRGFIFPGSDIYGGLANSWDYGPLGVELKLQLAQGSLEHVRRLASYLLFLYANT